MHSLRSRLWVLWALALAASLGVGLVLVQLYRTSTAAQVGRAEAVVARACDTIRDRYGFYVTGWNGSDAPTASRFGRDLLPVVTTALADQDGVEGGIWSAGAGSLAYAYPTYEGTGPKTDLPAAELPTIRATNEEAETAEQSVLRRSSAGRQILLLAACPLSGPLGGLTAWTMTRVSRTLGYDRLRAGIGLLLGLVLAIAGWVTWLTTAWGGHVRGIETALAAHDIEALPLLPHTGERELDRIVAALNDAGQRLSAARSRSAEMAGQVAASERLAALGRVAAGIAHEIRNPMAAMRLRAENALTGDGTRDRTALRASLEQIARVDRLIGELLAMTQRRAPEWQKVDVLEFLRQRTGEHRDSAAGADIGLIVEAPPIEAWFDPELIGRALDNLLLNAIRHTPTGGSVHVRAAEGGDTVRITVTDTGPGVDPALRSSLFEPFATGRPDGTGLGLAIAREMAVSHGGRLSLAEPADNGEGATFVLELKRNPPWQQS